MRKGPGVRSQERLGRALVVWGQRRMRNGPGGEGQGRGRKSPSRLGLRKNEKRPRSRSLQSLPPLDIGMSEVEEKPRVQATTLTCLQHPRSPYNFSDSNHVALFNGWDETMCLANVVFFLEGTAKCWFDNIEDDLTSWAIFKEKIQKCLVTKRITPEKLNQR
ncbi:hypothetical protein LAZ67_14001474 [Cordylochernes scorpioides]|uniref:Retrotransposon gag domain-containing protein n=1 Tax=Cordylochernes scorpioides TaxID=51811 RepID=A0ABY6L6X6_9ARAC|nr:hypothetical protein LAZ67_14001474 [Cordylochernes scorpioides]